MTSRVHGMILTECLQHLYSIPESPISHPPPSLQDWLRKKLSSLLNARFSHCSQSPHTWESFAVSSYLYISLSFQIFQHGHCLFPTLWMMLLNRDLELLGQDGQELLQHQQVQDLLLGMCVWSEPLMAELLEPAQGKLGSRGILVAEVPKTAAWRSPGQEAGSLEGWDPDSWGGLPPASLPPS